MHIVVEIVFLEYFNFFIVIGFGRSETNFVFLDVHFVSLEINFVLLEANFVS